MILITHVYGVNVVLESVLPIRNAFLALEGVAYTDKAFAIELERLRKLAAQLPRVQLRIEYSPDADTVFVYNKKKVIMYIKASKIEHFRVDNLYGELRDFETQADRALYNYAGQYEYGFVKPEEEK